MTDPQLLPDQRHMFDIPREIAYLNCAYMSPLMHQVVSACDTGLRRKARPWTVTAEDFFKPAEEIRALFARLINADAEGVAIIPAVSYGISLAARILPISSRQTIITLKDQFPSNVYPWRATAGEVVAVDTGTGEAATARVLEAITMDTAIVAVPNILWTTGARLDLVAIGAACRSAGAALVLDLSQSLGAMAYDNAAVQPDILVVANYKWLLGPYTTGEMWLAPKWRQAEPLEHTWLARRNSGDFARLVDYTDELQPGARRFDMGERGNLATLPGVVSAFRQLLDWGVDRIEASLTEKTRRLAAALSGLGLECPPEAWRGPHYLTARLPADAPENLVAGLADRHVHVSQRGAHLRITPHLYNDEEDTGLFLEVLRACLAGASS